MKNFDLIVIGGGSGMVVAESALAHKERNVAIIERAKFGGTCLNRGCIPSKMLVHPADRIREAQHAKAINIDFGAPRIDWPGIAKRMWDQIGKNEAVERRLKRIENLTVYKGSCAFIDRDTLRIEQSDAKAEDVSASYIVIAAGARSFVPPIEGLADTGYVLSETFFGDKFPKKPWDSLLIMGGGAIGAEFAHIFSAMGTKVTVIEMKPRILSTEEAEISAFVQKQFERDGIRVVTNHRVVSAHKTPGGKALIVENMDTKERITIEGEEIFLSAGVRSNADTLGLENTDVSLDRRGWIVTDEYLSTSQPNIYAIGDINGKYQFRHKANYEAQIVAHNLFSGESKRKAHYQAVPWAIFTHPQVAHVGLTQQQAQDMGLKIMVGRNTYGQVAGGIAFGYDKKDEDNGFVKVIAGEDKKILGAHIVGPYAAMLVQPFVYLMNAGLSCIDKLPTGRDVRALCPETGTYIPIFDSMVIHPSLNELTAWAIEDMQWTGAAE